MSWTVSTELEAALWTAAGRVLPAEVCGGPVLRQAVIERSQRYTTGREHLAAALPPPSRSADLAAHALFFAVADAAKIQIPLAELHGQSLLPTQGTLRILDIGAGPGAMTLGTLDFLHRMGIQCPVSVHAVDRDAQALTLLRQATTGLAATWRMAVSVSIESADITTMPVRERAYDLILAGSVLNEIPAPQRQPLLAALLRGVHAQGTVIIIEPALRETSRDLHALRDWVLGEGKAHVFAPCIRQRMPCPVLADENDWCHEDRPVLLPERTNQIAVNTGLRSHGLKFAYLVLRHDAQSQVAPASQTSASAGQPVRVVSQLLSSKGKHECFVCSDQGRQLVRLLRRNRSPDNRDFERTRRGDVLLMDRASGDIERGERVTLARSMAGPDQADD